MTWNCYPKIILSTLIILLTTACLPVVEPAPVLSTVPPMLATKTVIVNTSTPQPTEAPMYYPIGIVHVRTVEGEHVRYVYPDKPVQCVPQPSGWCLLVDGTRIWSGCLGIGEKGCKAK